MEFYFGLWRLELAVKILRHDFSMRGFDYLYMAVPGLRVHVYRIHQGPLSFSFTVPGFSIENTVNRKYVREGGMMSVKTVVSLKVLRWSRL